MARSLFSRPFDLLMVIYFISHVPITLLVDSQSLFPRSWYPSWAVKAVDDHVKDHGDHLVGTNPVWFKAFVWGEIILQLPVFIPMALGIIYESAWIRIPCIIYGTHVATTVQAMLAEFIFSETVKAPNWVAAGFYIPYMLLPVLLVLRMTLWDWPTKVTGKKKAKKA